MKQVILNIILLTLVLSIVMAIDCSEQEKTCLEYGNICTPIEDEAYLNCVAENERLQEECGKVEGGTCSTRHCSMSDRCESKCLKWGCEEDMRATSTLIEEEVVSVGNEEIVQEANSEEQVQAIDPGSPCEYCPEACEHIEDDGCGICNCPENLGGCESTGLRSSINNTDAYCFGRLWFEQKEDNQTCQNSFECISNFCSKEVCFDIATQVEQNTSHLAKILNWLFGWMG